MSEVARHLEALDQALERLRLEGAIFMRCEFSESWTFEGGGPNFAAMMHPGAERLVLFHVIPSGRCWVALPDGERHWASAGEVIVLPYGDEFTMDGVERRHRCTSQTSSHRRGLRCGPPLWRWQGTYGRGVRMPLFRGRPLRSGPRRVPPGVRGSAGGRAREELVRREHRLRTRKRRSAERSKRVHGRSPHFGAQLGRAGPRSRLARKLGPGLLGGHLGRVPGRPLLVDQWNC